MHRAGAMPRKLRLGMIGGGPGSLIGPVHRIAARLDGHFDLVSGAFSSDAARSQATGRDAFLDPARVYGDWRMMIEAEARRSDSRLDAIAIVTPNHLHYAQAKACLEAGFHVICDKPLATRVEDAEALAVLAHRTGLIFGLTHNYSAYPMIRRARAMVSAGELGPIRLIQVEYAQGWMSGPVETQGNRQAEWRVDPVRQGPGGALGDIGTHGYHLACFVAGGRAASLLADLAKFGAGRTLDDNAHILLKYESGARGMLWASQVAVGEINGLRLRIFGERASLSWWQERPNQLNFTVAGEPVRRLERGEAGEARHYASRLPAGHPEGFLEAFAQLYADLAEQIAARIEGRAADPLSMLVPTVDDGCEGVRFVHAAVESDRRGGVWLSRPDWPLR